MAMLQPLVVLVIWTLIVLGWAAAARLPAAKAMGLTVEDAKRTSEFGARLPPAVQWKMDNYNHLLEQPTLFYALALALAAAGVSGGAGLWLAWAYVVLRLIHSIVHGTSNRVAVRFRLFAVGNLCLIGMAVVLALTVFSRAAIVAR